MKTLSLAAAAAAIVLALAAPAEAWPYRQRYRLDPWSRDPSGLPTWGRGTYRLAPSHQQRNWRGGPTLQHRDGTYYDCNSFGRCRSRW